ncbi:AraC-like ligand-binding domain-containing protein [Nonomuraea sp. 10N515B]|uniref:AraC-like ligand-binding domain-containing protein n=1 Tax=Nonomuraea sp. 10N515B TaxID=3457422 RepID=UPI003FCC6A90
MKVWRASDQPQAARLEYFRHALADSIVPVDLLPEDKTRFWWEIRTAELGALRVVDFTAPTGQVVRGTKLIRQSDPELCVIRLQLSGHPVVEQNDRQVLARPGELVLVDLSQPVRVAGAAHHQVSVAVPRALLPPARRDIRDLAAVSLAGRHGALVAGLVRQIAADLDGYAGVGASRIGDAILDLTAAALADRAGREALTSEQRERVLMLRVESFVEQRLGDPDLTPAAVAAAHHMSLRTLYKLFESHERSVAGLIRARRVERCRRDLTDPAQAGIPVSAIGARWGFHDPTRFSRVFRAAYGMPPGEYRAQASSRWRTASATTAASPGMLYSRPDPLRISQDRPR